ncbi:hypothetical protein Pmani_001082 [Petrolisthes manimaculis]|uniref:Uncharacterized protein n=1 Tax=Petrolisthes manimaculis TaxID=1843537 RepID=A0AAE1QKV9_9EUCA|nr:hypothetical protein Pmani_001082 [Petrolisthes manimaculis]
MACIGCPDWVGLLKEATPDARPKLPAFLTLKAALTRLRRVVKNRDGSVLLWVAPSLGAEFGLSRIQYPASGNSESQGVKSLFRPINRHQEETSQSVARSPSVSSPVPGPSGVRPPTPQLVTSVSHSRGRKRRTKAKASSHKKSHRLRRSPSSSVSSSSSSSSTSSSDQSLSPRRRRKPAKVSHPVSREDLSCTMSAMLSSLLPTLLPQFLPAQVSIPAPTSQGLPAPLPPVPHQASSARRLGPVSGGGEWWRASTPSPEPIALHAWSRGGSDRGEGDLYIPSLLLKCLDHRPRPCWPQRAHPPCISLRHPCAAVSLHRGVEPVSMEDMPRSMSDMVSSLVPTLFPQLLPSRLPIPAPASHGVGRGGASYLPSCL